MRAALFLALALTSAAGAEPRPLPRPEAAVVVMSSRGTLALPPAEAAPEAAARPVPRLSVGQRTARALSHLLRDPLPAIDVAGLPRQSDRPALRPQDLILASGARPRPLEDQGPGICGRPSLRGER
ncbi:MAG: hypothetical protein AAF390_21130, partial [Pseudomonadota bacterium]